MAWEENQPPVFRTFAFVDAARIATPVAVASPSAVDIPFSIGFISWFSQGLGQGPARCLRIASGPLCFWDSFAVPFLRVGFGSPVVLDYRSRFRAGSFCRLSRSFLAEGLHTVYDVNIHACNYKVNTHQIIIHRNKYQQSNYHELTQQISRAMSFGMAKARQKLFSMRTDTDEGEAFLEALDLLREAELPKLDRTAMVKKLVFSAARKAEAEQERKRR
jgi:hypothetical protein